MIGGGGYGILVRILRDQGFDTFYFDEYAQNIFANSFEFSPKTKIDLITSFEVFEHLENPASTLQSMLKITPHILFSTLLIPEPIPPYQKENQWWYYSFHHGQHISFFSKESIKFLAKKHHLNYYNAGIIHLLTPKKINPIFFKVICKLAPYGLAQMIKNLSGIKSKTHSDSLMSQNAHSL